MLVNVGKGIEREIDPDALPLFALNHAIMIGLRNILMDSHASITSELYPSESDRFVAAESMVDKKLAALMSGDVRVQSTRSGDPIRAEAMKMAIAQIHGIIKANHKKVADFKSSAIREKAAARITPELLELARERVEQLKNAKPVVVESLADLGL